MSSSMVNFIAIIVRRSGAMRLKPCWSTRWASRLTALSPTARAPSEEQFRFHITQIRELGGYLCGRRLYGRARDESD